MNIIETGRLVLRPWRESDSKSLYKYAKNPNVSETAGWSAHKNQKESRDIIVNVLSANETYAITLRGKENAIGSIGIMFKNESNLIIGEHDIEIGYWIGEPFWGHGFVTEALSAVIEHAFKDLSSETIWCGYFEGNERSKRVQEKCGFKFHHTENNRLWAMTNEIKTIHISCLTREEFIEKRVAPI